MEHALYILSGVIVTIKILDKGSGCRLLRAHSFVQVMGSLLDSYIKPHLSVFHSPLICYLQRSVKQNDCTALHISETEKKRQLSISCDFFFPLPLSGSPSASLTHSTLAKKCQIAQNINLC